MIALVADKNAGLFRRRSKADIGEVARGRLQRAGQSRRVAFIGRMDRCRHDDAGIEIDRVLGFGFGALKGTVIAVIGFTLLVLGYDTVWGYAGRPDWIANARSYDFVDASSRSLADMVAERRQRLIEGQEADETPAS